VEYFFVPPANLDPQKKYPVVFYLRGKTQMDENAQLLANAGIYYIALKPVASAEPVYDNAGIMAVREVLLKNPNVDAQKIYLCAQDVNVPIASYALDDHPGVWRGMIIVSPKTSLTLPSSETKPPGFFVSTGAEDEERVLDRLAQFELDACRQLIPVRVDLQKKAKRAYRPEHYADCYQQIARFVALDW
jgi:predicted peptidase